MGETTQGSGSVHKRIGDRFDAILCRHVKRLLGTRYGIGGLPVNISAISCIILLAEQVKNEKRGIVQSDRYTREMLCDELTEMCLDADEIMDTAISDMIDRGYIQIDPDSGISVKEHTVRMARILDHIFPKMPGINLVAYLAQTMDEVNSGRKSLETAEDHFNQMLHLHGVGLKKKQIPQKGKPAPTDRQKTLQREILASATQRQRPTRSKVIKSSDFTSVYQKPLTGKKTVPMPPLGAAASPPAEYQGEQRKVEEIQPAEISTGEELLSGVQESPLTETDSVVDGGEGTGEPLVSIAESLDHETPLSETSPEAPYDAMDSNGPSEQTLHEFSSDREDELLPSETEEAGSFASSTAGILEDIEEKPVSDEKAGGKTAPFPILEGDEDVVGRKIAAFEEDLAMQCPICKNATIKTEKTSTGKYYYVCSDKHCTFISWGKPYHLVCPECGSPFLVESSTHDGKTILKCPRATCFHWQRHPSDTSGEDPLKDPSSTRISRGTPSVPSPRKKKVVRRKVVRKKR